MFQVISQDGYGSTEILGKFSKIDTAVETAKALVTEENINNALTLEEKQREWESYFVEVLDEDGQFTTEAVYGGKDRGKNFVYHFKDTGVVKVVLGELVVPMRFYIGTDNKKDLYAGLPSMKERGKFSVITDLDHLELREKTVYYIKII